MIGAMVMHPKQSGPCIICGDTDYNLSCGGPTICPKCDCGHFDAATVQQQAKVIAELRGELERSRGLLSLALHTESAPAKRRPDPAAQFVMWALMEGSWQGADIDGGAAQDKAEALGLITVTSYDPAKHGESDSAEPGDSWYVPSEMLLSALSSIPSQAIEKTEGGA